MDRDTLAAAKLGYQETIRQAQAQIAEIDRLLGIPQLPPVVRSIPSQRRPPYISPEGRERIRQAQKARWAKIKAEGRKTLLRTRAQNAAA
jgi:hypothetical protein